MRHHAAQRARALAGSVLRARGVAAGLVRSPEARGSACLPAPSSSSSHPAGLPHSPFAAWTRAAREGSFSGVSTRRWSSLASASALPDAAPPAAPPPTRGRLRQMRVAELRAACAARGLDDRGRKSNLVSRLEDAEEAVAFLEPANGSTAALEHHDANAYHTLAPTHTQTALDERAASSSSSSSSSSKSRERTRVLSPNEHGIDPRSIPRYVRTLQRRLARGDANAFSDGAVNKKHKKHRLFVVGGAARDLFLGKTPRDFDLLTDASWSAIKRRARPCVVVGRRFKVAHCFEEKSDAPGKRTGAFFELVSMRGEEEEEEAFRSRDGEIEAADFERRDDAREPLSAEETYDDATVSDERALDPDVARRLRADAFRRDFTVNALAYDVESGYLYDFVGAIEDIRSRVVRTVHPSAVLSFREDPARMLRAARVAARHDFVLAGAVTSALKASAHLLRTEHTARLAGELKALLTRGFSAKAVALLWTTGALEHVAHLHATHVARAVDPATNFVAAPPGAFHIFTETQTATTEAGEDTSESHVSRSEDDLPRSASVGGALANDPRTKHALPADLPWLVHDSALTGSALTRHRRGGKRVSDATLRRVVNEDPLFKMLRALDRRVARLGDGGACSETLAMACLAAPFAVKKLGWPFLEPEETMSVRPTRRESGESGESASGSSASGSPVRRFAGARFAARLAAFAASRSEGERLAWRAAAEKRADARVAQKKELKKSDSKSASRAPSESLLERKGSGSRWERAFAAWTEEAGYAARVMQADYHLSAKHVMASALVTMHAPFLRAAPAADVLRRRAELAASSKARPGKEVDFSATAKSATFSFASPAGQKTFSAKKRRRRNEDASAVADEGLARVLRLLAAGGDTASQTASRRASRRHGAKAKAKAAAPPGGGVSVAALPGELLAFAEILCDAALEGTAVTLDDAEDALDDEEDETDAERYEVGDEDFDPDEPL